MLLYTSLRYDAFAVLLSALQRSTLTYCQGWTPASMSLDNQLLLTLMKLRMNCQDADLAFRFGCSSSTVSNIFHTLVCALHELLHDGVLLRRCPSQFNCEGSVLKASDEFGNARASLDADLSVPPFRVGKSKFTASEVRLYYKIARARIHSEAANRHIKNYRILNSIPAGYRSISTKILQLCCCLIDLQAPRIPEIAEN
jgi:hypothetical protein